MLEALELPLTAWLAHHGLDPTNFGIQKNDAVQLQSDGTERRTNLRRSITGPEASRV